MNSENVVQPGVVGFLSIKKDNEMIEIPIFSMRYLEGYVVCPVCKRPDTKIVKEKRLSFLVCNACGAKSSIKQL